MTSAPTAVLCFPPAGAGPSFFAGWADAGGPAFEICAVDLPGRERLFAEPPVDSIPELARWLLPQIRARLAGRDRAVLLGHCFGALLAYETARRLDDEGDAVAAELVLCVSGSGAPGVQTGRPAHGLPDSEFLATVAGNTGVGHPALDDPELREVLLPVLRADVAAVESYRPRWESPARLPLITVRAHDDALVTAADVARWRGTTHRFLGALDHPGDHLSVREHGARLLPELARLIRAGTDGRTRPTVPAASAAPSLDPREPTW